MIIYCMVSFMEKQQWVTPLSAIRLTEYKEGKLVGAPLCQPSG